MYLVIDDAHLLDVAILGKLRLLFERFPRKHNLVLLGQPELLHRLNQADDGELERLSLWLVFLLAAKRRKPYP